MTADKLDSVQALNYEIKFGYSMMMVSSGNSNKMKQKEMKESVQGNNINLFIVFTAWTI